jgi:BlaR1 peptidase M56
MHWIESFSQLAAAAFVASLWQGVLLSAAVAVCLRLIPKMSAATRFAVWSAVFVVIMLLPFVHAYAGRAQGGISSGAMVQIDVRWSYAIASLWLGLSLMRAGKLALSAWRLHGLWKRSTPVTSGISLPSFAGSRAVELCTSAEIDRPSVIGFFSPRILIPEWLFEKLTQPELEQIVLHETGHISRADDWINLFQKIGLVLFPLNPVLMWIDRRLCFERELACDDGVLRCTSAPGDYAKCLVSVAERTVDRRAISLTLGAWERQSELSRRVHSILRRSDGMNPGRARLALSGIVLALVGGALGLSRLPHLVSFSTSDTVAERPIPMPTPTVAVPEYQPVVFHPAAAPHETLLRASLPVAPAVKPVSLTHRKASSAVQTPARVVDRTHHAQHAKQIPAGAQPWLVLTSWDMQVDAPVRSGMMLTVTDERVHLSRYAAVPTADGWLVIQL